MTSSSSIDKLIAKASQRQITHKTPQSRQHLIYHDHAKTEDYTCKAAYGTLNPRQTPSIARRNRGVSIAFTQLAHVAKVVTPFSLSVTLRRRSTSAPWARPNTPWPVSASPSAKS